jgi:hypothetical protein
MIYYDVVIGGVKIIHIVACDNYDGFQHLTFIFSHNNTFHYFKRII